MKHKKDKTDWFDGHVEVLGINEKWEKAFKKALKEKAIEKLYDELTEKSEVL
tara:strand:+ start:558 stop:713 length:156 start_codon:yes stop_codon:yes gene_type:complete